MACAAASWGFCNDANAPEPTNPIKADAKSITLGEKLYAGNCMACHGRKGKGDGSAAIILPTRPSDLSDPDMWEESDADLFKTITNGHKAMPRFKKLLTEEERWHIVNYLRILAPKRVKK